jgi:fatty acid desaturase
MHGVSYKKFLSGLKPRYWKVYADITWGYIGLFFSLIIAQFLTHIGYGLIAPALLGAIFVGYLVAYLTLFMHEASHYNIAPTRKLNDFLANFLTCWLTGTSIKEYRTIHFEHHKKLGKVTDTENSYFNNLSPLFLIKTLLGVRALEVLLSREKYAVKKKSSHNRFYWLVFGISIHLLILSFFLEKNWITAAAAWILGIAVFFPFFNCLRQVLEHRDEEADKDINYKENNHGAITRNFGNDWFSKSFGSAGFNKHLLHHWEPQVSYTNFAKLEEFYLSSPMKNILLERQSTYWRVFLSLMNKQ